MARGMVDVGVSTSTGNLAMALQHLPFLVCVAAVAGLCIGYARHRVLHRESSETDGERMELRSGRDSAILSSNLIQIKRNSFSFLLKQSFSRSVISSKEGNDVASGENVSNESPAIWQKAILRGERCVPLSFSGLVLYDEKGNMLPRGNRSFIR